MRGNRLLIRSPVSVSVRGAQRNGKTSACNVVKVTDGSGAAAQRPERMLQRLKINSIDDTVPRVIVMRQPKGPAGTGFGVATRVPRLPGEWPPTGKDFVRI